MRSSPFTNQNRPNLHRLAAAAASCTIAMTLAACASSPGAVFEPANGSISWPPPPDPPRIRYVGQLRGESDLRPAKSGIQRLGESLFGSEPTEVFLSPVAVCSDGADRIFIADSHAHVVHMLDMKTRAYKRLAPKEPGQQLALPVALAYDPAGRLLVSDSVAGQIVVFDSSGKRTGTLGTGNLQRPCGLVVNPTTHQIFVADAAAHQIVVLNEDGTVDKRIGTRGSEIGEFNFPTNVTLDAAGRLYVSDSLNFRIQVFGPNLEPIRQVGRKGDMPGYFSQPKGISVDPEGHLYVVDANFEAVQVFDAEGNLLMSFGREGQGPGEFWLPAGLFIDPRGRIWVADSYNKRIQVFDYLPEGMLP